MSQYFADLHIHSRFSRACSKDLTLENINASAKIKGLQIVGTGDFCHPVWFKEISTQLMEAAPGLFRLKKDLRSVFFVLTNEISCIYSQGGKVRRLHICLLAPSLKFVEELNNVLTKRGCKLSSDGRPIIGMSAKELLKICLEIDPFHLTFPAHAWTPWFAIFGSKSGFDSIEECYGELSSHILAIETGLSSDPLMNWGLSKLDKITLLSNSDAHSLPNLGREANVFELSANPSFAELTEVIRTGNRQKFLRTIEFFPEAGMYHYDGHRDCGVCFSPEETFKNNGICPKCKKPLTIGVLNRVKVLTDVKEPLASNRVPYVSIMPLTDILSLALGVGKNTKKVDLLYQNLIKTFGNEFNVLLNADFEKLSSATDENTAKVIINVREGKIKLEPGFDGQYGKLIPLENRPKPQQNCLF